MQPSLTRRYFSVIVGEGCNARCTFCIAPDRMKDAAESLPVDQALAAAAWAAAQGATVGSVSGGGEPLMLAVRNAEGFDRLSHGLAALFSKVDLHSNYAVPVGIRKADLYPTYTDLTVSLWPTAEVTRTYLGTATHDRTVATLLAEQASGAPRRLRLSATLGQDWARSITDIRDYAAFARHVGATAITLRPLITPPLGAPTAATWIAERRLDGATVTEWLHQARYPVIASTVRNAEVFDVDGVKVCVYRYAAETGEPDTDFFYFRPSTRTGTYGLYTDYSDDTTLVK